MAHRADGLNDIFEHDVTVRDNLFVNSGIIQAIPVNNFDIVNKAYCDGNIVSDYWKTLTAQTGLTGNKTGSFNLTTTGTINVGSSAVLGLKIAEGSWLQVGNDTVYPTTSGIGFGDRASAGIDSNYVKITEYVDDGLLLRADLVKIGDYLGGGSIIYNSSNNNLGINTAPVANQMITESFTNSSSSPYFNKGTYSATGNNVKTAKGYYLDMNISGTSAGPYIFTDSRGYELDLDDTTNYSEDTPISNVYGFYSDVNFAGTNNANQALTYFAGLFSSSGNIGTTGSTTHYGISSSATGTADTNIGVSSSASGATINWAFYAGSGNSFLGGDNAKTMWGTTNTDLNIFSDGTNGIIDVATALRLGNDVTNYMECSSTGVLKPVGSANYSSSDGSAGATGTITLASVTTITVKNGLITAWA